MGKLRSKRGKRAERKHNPYTVRRPGTAPMSVELPDASVPEIYRSIQTQTTVAPSADAAVLRQALGLTAVDASGQAQDKGVVIEGMRVTRGLIDQRYKKRWKKWRMELKSLRETSFKLDKRDPAEKREKKRIAAYIKETSKAIKDQYEAEIAAFEEALADALHNKVPESMAITTTPTPASSNTPTPMATMSTALTTLSAITDKANSNPQNSNNPTKSKKRRKKYRGLRVDPALLED